MEHRNYDPLKPNNTFLKITICVPKTKPSIDQPWTIVNQFAGIQSALATWKKLYPRLFQNYITMM